MTIDPPQPPVERRRASWDWTDIVLTVLLGLVLLTLAVAFVQRLDPSADQSRIGHDAWLSLLSTVLEEGALLVPAVYLVLVRRRAAPAELGLRLPVQPRWLAIGVGSVLVVLPLTGVLELLNERLLHAGDNPQVSASQDAYSGTALSVLLGLVAAAVVAPIAEEVFFRGFIYGWLRGITPVPVAVGLSGAVFAGLHLYLQLLLPLFAFGVILAVLRERSRSLYPGMLLHGTFNLISLLVILKVINLPF